LAFAILLSLYLRERAGVWIGVHGPSDEYDIRAEGEVPQGWLRIKGLQG